MSDTAQDLQPASQDTPVAPVAAPPPAPTAAPPAVAPPPAPLATAAAPPVQGQVLPRRSPMLAAIFSFLPGFGNVYNGLFSRGLLTFLVFFGFMFIAQDGDGPEMAILVPAMIFTWLFGVVDAYRNATLINLGVTEVELRNQMPEIKAPDGGLAIGVALFLIGLYGLLTQAMDIDLSVIFDYWYLILMGFGGWMIFHGYQNRKQNDEPTDL